MWSIRCAVAAATAVAIAHAPAAATIITINGTTNAQIECVSLTDPVLDPACYAFSGGAPNGIGNGVGDPTATGDLGLGADLYDGVPAGDQFELDQINILTGQNFTVADFNKSGEDPGNSFQTLALYVLLKLSNTSVWIKNLSGGVLMVTYTDSTCQGGVNQGCFKAGGLSHYSEVGEVPLPGAIWLMGVGLVGLGFAGRKKQEA